MEPADSNLPTQIGRYKIERLLGRGAMGRVLLAHDPVLDRSVAIKLLRDDLNIPPEQHDTLLHRMRQEARASARVSHPNIVALHDMGEDPELGLCLVFEYAEGQTLKERLLRGPLGPLAARLSSKAMFRREFARLFSANHPLSAEEADAQWALMSYNGGHRIAHLLISYLGERERYAQRWHGAVRDWPKPLSFLWALDDPVATTNVLDGLRELRPAADVVELPGVGHYPQVEVPDVFTRAAGSLLSMAS